MSAAKAFGDCTAIITYFQGWKALLHFALRPKTVFPEVIDNLQSQCLKGKDLKTKTVFQRTDSA